jgi:hypothetical protein
MFAVNQRYWSDDDCDVRECNGVVGSIVLHLQAPKFQPWSLTIRAHEFKPSLTDRGYTERP